MEIGTISGGLVRFVKPFGVSAGRSGQANVGEEITLLLSSLTLLKKLHAARLIPGVEVDR